MIEIDKTSLLVTTDTDTTVSDLEKQLRREGFTLNYYPVTGFKTLLADALNERIPNLYTEAYGGIEDLCVQLRVAKANGAIYENRLTPRSATGPNFKKLVIGSKESWGVPLQSTLRIFHEPTTLCLAYVLFPTLSQQEFFLQGLRKKDLKLPLAVPSCKAPGWLAKLPQESSLLGLALWGQMEVVEALWEAVQALAQAKKGEWYEVEDKKEQELASLHRQGVVFQKHQRKQTPVPLPTRQLLKAIQEI